ncbi:hypothetical protein HXX76_002066 [Chlamydomonas incerta]|uniref:Protein MON2 homolog n=1 Tax=Chlamydomonas incerta TaxID=51695 RepID=A0A836B002_CHLIN|nr:hypothetical protein HXX76_002066 [Chlamydomonas incerta]|eukprot:KAG2443720.1 hypothetical protein HXX76_002066 [Chlamydomonas incerta]
MGMLHHSELPALRDATERAARKVREVEERQAGLAGVQQALEILTPFVRACETKYPKLACIGLSAFQKLLANDAVSIQGRLEIIRAFQAAEKLNDENVKLRILQASLTIIQSASFADEQDGVQQLLSVIFRLYVTNKSNQAVQSTAAATIRQAVALVFDHSVMRVTRTTMSASFSPVMGSPIASLSPMAASVSTPISRSGGGYAALTSSSAAGTPLSAGGGGGEAGQAVGREAVPVLLLEEMMGWLGEDKEVGWIQLPPKAPRPDDTFLYEMLEGVLLQRAGAIHKLPALARVVRHKVAPLLVVRLDRACRKGVDENLAGDCRLVVRCAAALVRRHHDLAPEAVSLLVARLAETAGSVVASGRGAGAGGGAGAVSSRWQRFMALQALRPLLSDPYLLYRMYHLPAPQLAGDKPGSTGGGLGSAPNSQRSLAASYPAPGEASAAAGGAGGADAPSGGPLPAVVRCLQEALMWYVRTASDSPDDDVVGALGNLYLQRAMGARDAVQETEAFGVHLAQGSEVVIAHLGLECVLGAVAATEALADVVVVPAEPGMPSPKLVMRDTPDVRCAAVAGLVRLLWPAGLAVTDTLLRAARHDVLVQLLVRALQTMTYCAGALGEVRARDCLLARLCTHALLPPGEDDMGAMVAAATGVGLSPLPGAGGGGEDRSVNGSNRRTSSVAAPAATAASFTAAPLPPGFLTAILNDRGGGISAGGPSAASGPPLRVVLTPRNIAALRSLFNLAHRLADALGGSGWLYVVDAVNALDRILASPHTTTAAYLMETEGEMAMGLQPAYTGVGVPGGGGGAGGGGGGGGMTPMPSAAPGGVVPLPSAAAAALAGPDGDDEDGATSAQRELRILSSAADQLFENTHHMSPEAVVSLLGALSEISHRTLAGMGLLAAAGATAAAAAGAAGAAGGMSTGGGLVPAASGLSGMMSMGGASAASLGSGPGGAAGAAGGAAASAGGALGGVAAVVGGAGLTGGGAAAAVLVVQPVVGPGGLLAPPAPGPVRLCALNRMVDTLLHNLWRVQDLWGIFLAHVLEALGSGNAQVRTAALDALDRTITGALNPELQHVPDKFTAPLPMPEDLLSPLGTLGAADSMLLAAGRRGSSFLMTPSLPSFAMSLAAQQAALQLPGSVGPPSPGPGPGGGMASRRMSRDVPPWAGSGSSAGGGGGGGGGPATSTLTASLQQLQLQLQQQQLTPGSGSQPASLRPSMDAAGRPPMPPQLASPSPPAPLPGAGTGATPFASSLGNATVAAGPGSPGAGFGVGGFMSSAAASPPSFTLMAPGALAAAPTATLTTITATATTTTTTATTTTTSAAATAAAVRGVQQAAQSEDVQHMLLVALDSLYREGSRSADVRRGLLRIALHVLQHHGDGLTRGWVPLMRLLEAVPRAGQDPQEVRLGFQVVELLATDYLASSLPKEHVAKALDVVAKFAQQDVVLNVSLTAITMLWNVSDHLARSRGTLSKGRAAQHLNRVQSAAAAAAAAAAAGAPAAAATPAAAAGGGGGTPQPPPGVSAPVAITASGTSYNLFSASAGAADAAASTEKPMSPAFAAALNFARGVPSRPATSSPGGSLSAPGLDQQPQQPAAATSTAAGGDSRPGGASGAAAAGAPVGASAAASAAGAAPAGGYPLHDLNEEESIAMLMIAFRSLKSLSVDPRPEARNAAVRTLFLAVCSHGGKFPPATWHELFWQLLFELLTTIHRVSATSSREEAAAVELGKERGGRSVVMLVHHSRNSEQKQWDETLVLALAGAGKVLRSYLPLLSGLDVWGRAWEELMQILGDVLASGRKGVSMAATSLLTTILQAHGTGPLVTRTMWRQSLGAIDRGVTTMAAPNTSTPLQARAELLACISTLASLLLLRTKPSPAGGSALDSFASVATSASGGADLPGPGSSFLLGGAAGAASLSAAAGGSGAGAALPPGEPEHLLMFVGWLDRFARYPVGAEDSSTIHFTTIGPIQKAVLGALAVLPPAVTAAGAWPEVLGVLCHMLRPFNTLALRQYSMQQAAVQQACVAAQRRAAAAAAAAAAADAAAAGAPLDSFASATSAASASTAPGSRDVSAHAGSSSIHGGGAAAAGAGAGAGTGPGAERAGAVIPAADDALEARAMSPQWMAKVAEMLATWYRDQVSWQVRVATFPLLVAALSECMACRHLQAQQQLLMIQQQQQAVAAAAAAAGSAGSGSGSSLVPGLGGSVVLAVDAGEPLDELWRAAARGFVTVVQTGLPSINICSQATGSGGSSVNQQVPQSTWPALARAFQMFFLATSLPPLQQPPADAAASIAIAAAAAAAANMGRGGSAVSSITSDAGGGLAAALAAPSAEQVAADSEITAAVLDCLSDTVLSSCQHAPVEVRRALVEVLDAGASSLAAPAAAGISAAAMAAAAAAPPPSPSDAGAGGLPGRGGGAYDESGQTPGSRLSHVCLAKLYVLCSRGQEQPDVEGRELPGVRSQMEVAQLALPVFVSRCESILLDYTRAEQHARSALDAASSPEQPPPASPRHGHHHSGQHRHPHGAHGHVAPALHDKAVHVIELLQQLKVMPAVSDALLSSRPHLRFWLDVGRAVRMQVALPPAPAAAAAAAAAGRDGSGAGAPPAPFAAGVLTPPPLSRRSSSGTDALSGLPGAAGGGSVAGGSVAGDIVPPSGPSNGGLAGRASTSSQGSFFSRTYSSTGALLSSAMAVAAGTGGAAPAAGNGPSANGGLGQSPSGRQATDGSGGGAQTLAAQRGAAAPGSASGGPLAVPPAAAAPVLLTGKLQWAKEQPQVAALYGVLVECIGSGDPVIRASVQGMLAGLGGGLGLCATPTGPGSATGLR